MFIGMVLVVSFDMGRSCQRDHIRDTGYNTKKVLCWRQTGTPFGRTFFFFF